MPVQSECPDALAQNFWIAIKEGLRYQLARKEMIKIPNCRIFVANDDQFSFHLVSANGDIILGSEGYAPRPNFQVGTAPT